MRAYSAVAVVQLVQFWKIYISQGNVATRFGCGGIFNNGFNPIFPQSLPVKEFRKSVEN